MSFSRTRIGWLSATMVLWGLTFLLMGCAGVAPGRSGAATGQGGYVSAKVEGEEPAPGSLHALLAGLSPDVQAEEAAQVAACANDYPLQLAREYRLVRPPLFHNLLVNLGLKPRGLCYHWAEDLIARLEGLQLTTLQVRWAIARAGSVREHNAVVITAKDRPFATGVLLDAWRHSGRLFWTPVPADRYPWEEGELTAP